MLLPLPRPVPGLALLALAPHLPVQDGPYVPRIEPASEEAAQALGRFTTAPGVELRLFAAEPRLANPVAFHIDFDGTVYVAETFRHHQGVTDIREHMDWLDDDLAARTVADRLAMFRKFEGEHYDPGYGRAFDQVRRIVDRDGDLVADEDTVFASDFSDHAAGIGAGVLADHGTVYYTCIPDLWRLRDPDGDGVAEERTRLSTGYGVHVALLGHDLHGLRIGPDRRLYFSCGDRGFHVETKEGVIAHPLCGAVLRCELDGSGLEVWHTGLRNPQELVFDELGNLWTGDNNSDGGDRARWVNVVEGGDSGWRYPYQWITAPVARGPWNDEKLWHPRHDGQAAYLVPPVANLADGPSGLTHDPGTGLSSAWARHFFLCDFRGDASASGIHAFTVEPRGASWALGPVKRYVWGALATDCDFGPDGALWFSDWVYGWEQTGKGRLYRAVDAAVEDSALVEETRTLLATGMEARSEDELVELLAHPDQRVRQEAHFALAERGDPARLTAVATDPSRPFFARLHALWALWVRSRGAEPEWGAMVALAEDPDPELRAQALRVLGDLRIAQASAARVVSAGLSDVEPRVRFFAALAAGRIGMNQAVGGLRRILVDAGTTDTNLRHAAVMGLVGCVHPEDLERLSGASERDVRMGALLVMRRHGDPSIARFLLDDDPLLVLEAARAIHDLPIAGALESLARARVEAPQLAVGERALVRRVLNANYRLGRAETLASYAERSDLSEESRVEALELLRTWRTPSPRDRVTNEWRPLEERSDPGLEALAVRLAASLADAPDGILAAFARFAGEARAGGAAGALAAVVGARERGSALKGAALEALERMQSPELVPAVRVALADVDGRVRASALERLARLAPDEALTDAAALVASGEIAERRAAYRILGRDHGPRAAEALRAEIGRLSNELVPEELRLDLARAVEEHGAPELAALLAERARARTDDAALAPFLDALYGGDAGRGSDVFQRVDLSCTRCHAWWANASERVGPNLFGVGQRLTRLQVLESIVGPNRRITPGYGARAFFLRDGRVVSGRVFEESESLVRLFDAQNNPIALERAEIEEERPDLSAMPEDLAKGLTPADMRDLLEYLARL